MLDEWSSLPPLPEALLAPSARVLAGLFVASCGAGEGLLARSRTLVRPAHEVFDRAFRVNVGGPEYVATTGHRFCADQGVIGGKVFTNHAIADVANRISKLIGFSGTIVWNDSKPNGQPRRRLDVRRAEERFGFRAMTSLDVGLRQTIDWYLGAHGAGLIVDRAASR